ncbi:hypothetical protein [Sphingomicrobium marinum]|uniref:hypothetical protein n=1 Tax=Sphingomicrobium marinum TaxID=1227950 RepID=UPI002240878B|nr:hypothetical protein [Sphingomicrobium marinum]
MLDFTQDQWILVGMVFLLGIFAGMFLLSGGSRKWKERYRNEVEKRERIEADYKAAETEWREKDSLRAAALRSKGIDVEAVDDGEEAPPPRA